MERLGLQIGTFRRSNTNGRAKMLGTKHFYLVPCYALEFHRRCHYWDLLAVLLPVPCSGSEHNQNHPWRWKLPILPLHHGAKEGEWIMALWH